MVSFEVRVRVRIGKLLGSDSRQCKFRVIVRVMVKLGLGLWMQFDPNR